MKSTKISDRFQFTKEMKLNCERSSANVDLFNINNITHIYLMSEIVRLLVRSLHQMTKLADKGAEK